MVILYSVIQPLKDLTKATYAIPKGMASMERINKILLAENPIREPEHPTHIEALREHITFKDVRFAYKNANSESENTEVIRGVSFTVRRGQTIALVGQSGSGKSTLVDLVPRFHDVTAGSISIDGHDVRTLRLSELRALIGNVNQEAILFNDTFFNNISFGVENATLEQVQEAAKVANAHDFIMATEDGYDTSVGDRGCRLSGGQRQRISIARAILKNPDILILDEATSALDTESERLVQEALERLMSTRTTIAIAHRLSTVRNADEILVLHEGQIVERGTHDALIALDGYYKTSSRYATTLMQKHHSFAQHFLLFSTMKFHFSLLFASFSRGCSPSWWANSRSSLTTAGPDSPMPYKSIGTAYRSTSLWRLTSPPRCGWF